MKLALSHWFSCLILSVSCQSIAAAADISGSISFIKKPPMVGIAYIPSNEANEAKAVIDQIDKQFTSKMAVVKTGDSVTFKNSDAVEHNVFANDTSNAAKFDVGLMAPGGEKNILVDWNKDSIVRVGCKIHPKMRTYLTSINTPYHKIIEFEKHTNDYTFTIANIPADAKQLIFKIPKYDVVTFSLADTNNWTADITKKGKVRGQLTITKK